MSVAEVSSYQQRLSCPGMSGASTGCQSGVGRLLPRGERGPNPAVPGIGHEEASRATVAQRDPSKAAEPLRLRVLSAVCSAIALLRIPLISKHRSRMSPPPSGGTSLLGRIEQGRTEDCRLYGQEPCGPQCPRKPRIRVRAPLGGVSVTSAGLTFCFT